MKDNQARAELDALAAALRVGPAPVSLVVGLLLDHLQLEIKAHPGGGFKLEAAGELARVMTSPAASPAVDPRDQRLAALEGQLDMLNRLLESAGKGSLGLGHDYPELEHKR